MHSICIQIVRDIITRGEMSGSNNMTSLGSRLGNRSFWRSMGRHIHIIISRMKHPGMFFFCFSTLFFFPFQVESVGMRDVDDVANHLSS